MLTPQDLEDLAKIDPEKAMALALADSRSDMREQLRNAVLRGWASLSPGGAASWGKRLPEQERHSAFEAVFEGASQRPEDAIEVCRNLGAEEPTLFGDYGQLLITSLAESGNFSAALKFAQSASTENVEAWTNAVFFRWAAHEPEQAWNAFAEETDEQRKRAALEGLVSGWSGSADVLAARVLELPKGEDRGTALTQMLSQWVNRDPGNATSWLIDHYMPAPDLDEGTAKVATLPTLISRKPEIAVAWAESISQPALRASTLRRVAYEWALQNSAEANQFLASNPGLPVDERDAIAAGLVDSTRPPSSD